MTGLLRSELLRARSRRVVWVLTIVAVAGVLVGVTIGAINSHRPSPQELAAAEARYERALERCIQDVGQEVPPGFASVQAYCQEAVIGLDQPAPGNDVMELRDAPRLLEGLSPMLVLLGAILGATLVGADWASGTFGTLLTWEPRRTRVVLVRFAVITLTALVVTGLLQALFVVSFRIATGARGSTVGAPDWLPELAWLAVRVSLSAAALSVVAAALATIGRSTVLAIGTLFGYLVLVEGFLSGLVNGIERWLLVRVLAIVVSDEPGYFFSDGATHVESVTTARAVLLAYVLVLTAAAVAVMRGRDVQ